MKESDGPFIILPGVDDVKTHTEKHYGDAKYERQPDGMIFVNGREVGVTMQCCHCGQHFLSIRHSGTRRGFCLGCMHITCGAEACMPCKPYAKALGL